MSALSGRTALVTGAGSGLGRTIALALAAAGVRVIGAGRTEPLSFVQNGRWCTADVSDEASVAALAAAVAGEDVSILINNAGIPGPVKPLTQIEAADWDEVFDVNVRGVFLMCRAFLPAMTRAGRGDIINLASVSGKRPLVHRTPYVASKLAIIGLTRTLAFEAGPLGVSVNTLSPGPVRGPRMTRNFRLEAEHSGITDQQAEHDFVSRAADVDLSAGMIAP